MKFDFGTTTSPVADGWVGVDENTLYSAEAGYGITELAGGLSRDRGADLGDDAQRDWVARFNNPWEFKVDLPNGAYDLEVAVGEMVGARAISTFQAEGVDYGRYSVTGAVQHETFEGVNVSDGQLNLIIGGSTGHLNLLVITESATEPTPDPDPDPTPEPDDPTPIEPGDPIDITADQPLMLDFGDGAVAEGYTQVTSASSYSPETGFGFVGGTVSDVTRNDGDALREDFVTVAGATFVANLPNQDYSISLVAGDSDATSEIEVTAEMQQKVPLTSKPAGEYLETGFDIALVDGQLLMEFAGSAPKLNALVITPLPQRSAGSEPTVYLTGDSTVQTYDPYWVPQAGWGQMIDQFFTDGVTFDNHAIGGRSSKTFITEGRLDAVLRQLKPEDYLLIQFGHNDATISVPERYASPEDYKEYLRTFVLGARQRDAVPVLVTPVSRLDYDHNAQRFNISFAPYVDKMNELAEELDVLVVDLSTASREYLDEIGYEEAHSVFLHVPANVYPNRPTGTTDNTHFQEYGAIQMARLVALGVEALGVSISDLVRVSVPETVPGSPTSLEAVTVSNASVSLEWQPVEGADVYRIYRAPAGTGDYQLAGTSTLPQALIGGLDEGVTYDLRVSAANARGEGQPGEAITVTTRAATLRFDFGPAGSPVEPDYTLVTPHDSYDVERGFGFVDASNMIDRDRGDSAGNLMQRDFVASFNVPYEFKLDLPNGTYAARITVGDLLGTVRSNFEIEGVDRGGMSISRNHTTRVFEDITVTDGQLNIIVSGATGHLNGLDITPILVAPTSLQVDDIQIDDAYAAVTLSWDASDEAASYRVYRDSGAGAEYIGETTQASFTDESAQVGLTYSYSVTMLTEAGRESQPSLPVEAKIVDAGVATPGAPQGLTVGNIEKNSIDLSWDPYDGALAYVIYRHDEQRSQQIIVGYSEDPSFTDETVLTTIRYTYTVAAINAGGIGAQSEPVTSDAATTLVRAAENIDRAPVGVATDDGVYLGWRMLGLDPESISFHVYRDGVRITDEPITSSTNLLDEEGNATSSYRVSAVVGGAETWATEAFRPWSEQYLDVQLDRPEGGVTPDGVEYVYHANDAMVGDLTGDGSYEIVVMWNPSNAKDNSHSGYTGNVYLDAYTMSGEQLWRIDLGRNIRAGAHYSMPMVYDFDGDGRSELMVKTAEGTFDGQGQHVISDANPDADHRNSGGYILQGSEYLTVFDGSTGAAIDTVDYLPPRGDVGAWGDGYGNRVDRFLAAVAYLDGETPSAVFSRGYYTRTVLAAYDFDGEQITNRWVFDSATPGNGGHAGQGNHNLSVADVDRDGKDEIIFGSMTIDDDGTGLYNTGLGHGDAMHLGDHIPWRDGLEVFAVHESMGASGNRAATMRDAGTGEIIWSSPGDKDTGRGVSADIDPRHPGNESWHIGGTYAWDSAVGHMFTAEGEVMGTDIPAANFVTWWDGDLLREITDHRFSDDVGAGQPVVSKWDWSSREAVSIFEPAGVLSNNSTKGTPSLQADLFGDWREELVFRTADSSALRIFTTTDQTEHRIRTLMHDPVYRLGIAWQHVSYNQPPHPSFFLGEGMDTPPVPSIRYTVESSDPEPVLNPAVQLTRDVVRAGDPVMVTATGFAPGETLSVTWNGDAVTSVTADTAGSAVIAIPTRNGTKAGAYQVEVTGQGSAATAVATVVIRKGPPQEVCDANPSVPACMG